MTDAPLGDARGSVARTVHEIFLTSFLGPEDDLLDLEVLGAAFARLADAMTDDVFEVGQVVFDAGQPARDFLFVASGEIVEEVPDGTTLLHQERGVVGVAEATAGSAYRHRATAVTRVHVVRLAREALFDVVEDHFVIAQVMMRNAGRGVNDLRLLLTVQDRYPPLVEPVAPAALDRDPTLVQRIVALRESPTFRRAPMQAVTKLAELSRTVRVEAGQRPPDGVEDELPVSLVLSGALEVRRLAGPPLVERAVPGEIPLLDALLAGRMAEYDVVAITAAALLVFDLSDLFDVMEEHTDVVREVLNALGVEGERLIRFALSARDEPLQGPSIRMSRAPGAGR